MTANDREEMLRRSRVRAEDLRLQRDHLSAQIRQQTSRLLPVAPRYAEPSPLGTSAVTVHVITTLEAR